MSKELSHIVNSTRGKHRKRNQDRTFVLINQQVSLFAIFDGVSSLPNSYQFIEKFIDLLKKENKAQGINHHNLASVLFQIHSQLLDFRPQGMSTLCLVCIPHKKSEKVYAINIGDSPLYVITNQSMEKLSDDDVLCPGSNILTKNLGMSNLCREDFTPVLFDIPGKMLLCSDGFAQLMEADKKNYFAIFQYKRLTTIKHKIKLLQTEKNLDDSTFILIKR